METPALVAALGAGAGAAVTLLLVAVVWASTRRRRSRTDVEAMLGAAQRENDDLRRRLEELSSTPVPDPGPDQPAYVITHVGEGADTGLRTARADLAVPDRLVLSATLGEPLVKVAAFSHGVRRALSARSRNRIWFEMRSEVRSARRQRLRLRKQLMREYRARRRATDDLALEDLALEEGA
ncbi:MAG: hypothetical protein ACJ72A_22010 [Nocardioidaceae bacterium]